MGIKYLFLLISLTEASLFDCLEWMFRSRRPVEEPVIQIHVKDDVIALDRFIAIQNARETEDKLRSFYAPEIDDPDSVVQTTSLGTLILKRLIASTASSTIYSISPYSDYVLKYQMDCFDGEILPDGRTVHPLVIEQHFINSIKHLGIAPSMLLVSPPIRVIENQVERTAFYLEPNEYDYCLSVGSSLRYALIEDVGISLYDIMSDYPKGILPLKRALDIGIQSIELIKKLHEDGGILHNDVHYGNLMVKGAQVKIIDFGRAQYFQHIEERYSLLDPADEIEELLSPWEMLGYTSTRRDDVYRTIFTIASLINGHDIVQRVRKSVSVTDSISLRQSSSFITGWGQLSQFENISIITRRKVSLILQSIARSILELTLNQRPPYEFIKNSFEEILGLLPD